MTDLESFLQAHPVESAFDEFGRYVSPSRAALFAAIGFPSIQGRREGVRFFDQEGRGYINCRSSGGVFNFGHRPPRMVEALRTALDELDIGDWLLPSRWRAEAARRLSDTLPGGDWVSFFLPGGGEAVDVALKLARLNTKRNKVVSAEGGYHGHTGFAISAGSERFTDGLGELIPHFERVPFGDAAALEATVDHETAAVIFETIPATAGMLIPGDDFYPRMRAACDRTGAVMILDEVQSGLGRTGRVWAFEEWGVEPDIVVTGKGLSGAVYPVSACCYRAALDAPLMDKPNFHPTSYGGAELGMVVAATVLDEIAKPGFLEHVRSMGERFEAGFTAIAERHGGISEFRRRGLMMGYDLPSETHALLMTQKLIENGVVAIFADNRPFAMQCMPPLIISESEVDEVLAAIERSLASVLAELGT